MSLMVLGIGMAIFDNNVLSNKTQTITAATTYDIPKYDISSMQIPLDLRLDQAKKVDTQETTNLDSSKVTKVDNHVVKVPVVVERKVEVPVLYIATPKVNRKPNDAIYSVHKIDGDIDIPVPDSLGVEPYEE